MRLVESGGYLSDRLQIFSFWELWIEGKPDLPGDGVLAGAFRSAQQGAARHCPALSILEPLALSG
jgi:hypothetical protein